MVLTGRLALLALVDELRLGVARQVLVRRLFHTALREGFGCELIGVGRFVGCVRRGSGSMCGNAPTG
jgi:hypothetical protein